MPSQSRPITLTTAVGDGGIRCYTKSADGIVRELCYDDQEPTKGWFAGELTFKCGTQSALCAIGWPGWNISVFYQDNKGAIREKYHNTGGWKDPAFVQPDCLEGTNIASVHDEKGEKVVLFYQGVDGFMYSRTRDAQKWKDPIKIGSYDAAPGTGIAAVVLKDAKGSWQEIRVYFQDRENTVKEFAAEYNAAKWVAKTSISWAGNHQYPIGDITAVSWNDKAGQQIRLYIQDQAAKIVEYSRTDKIWTQGEFKAEVLVNADMCAVVRPARDPAAGIALSMFWAGQDRHIYQCTNIASKWNPASQIARILETGRYTGTWIGKAFTDNVNGADHKSIKALHVRELQGRIVGLRIDYTDGSNTGEHGISSGVTKTFDLRKGDITQIWYHGNDQHVLGLRFGTNTFEKKNGKREVRTSPWYGTPSKGVEVWSENGMAFIGFDGVQGIDGIVGLQPIWSATRLATADSSKIPDIVAKVKELDGQMKTLSGEFTTLAGAVEAHSKKTVADLKTPAAETGASIVAMARSVEYLFDLSLDMRAARLGVDTDRQEDFLGQKNKCQANAKVVEAKTVALKSVADKLKAKGDEIHAEIDKLQKNVQTTSGELTRLKDSADALEHVLKAKNAETRAKHAELKELLPAVIKNTEDQRARVIAEITEAETQAQIAKASAYTVRTIDQAGIDAAFEGREIIQLFNHAVLTLKAREAEIQRVDEQLQRLDAQLAGLAAADKSSDDLEERTNKVAARVQELHSKDEALCAHAERLAAKLDAMARLSTYLDDNTVAQAYAKDLLEVVKPALQVDVIRTSLGIHPDTLSETVADIAKHK